MSANPPANVNGLLPYLVQQVMAIADRYGPTGILVLSLLVGMSYTTTWLREESKRNESNSIEQQAGFLKSMKSQQDHFDKMLEREHLEFKESLNLITKTFNDVMLRKTTTGAGQ